MNEEKFDVKELLDEQNPGFDYLRLTFADLHGISRSQSVPRRHFKKFIKNGVSLFAGLLSLGPRTEMTLVSEMQEVNLPNCNFLPMPGTFHSVPWAGYISNNEKDPDRSKESKYKVAEVYCESSWIKPYRDGAPQDACTRYVARKQLDRLKELGYALKCSYEAEFIVYDSKTSEPVFKGVDAGTTLRLAKFEEYLYHMEEQLKKSGVDIVSIIVEHGEGQFEFGMEPVDGIGAADAMFLIKQAIKEMTQQRGWTATFMARPFSKSATNGLHFNHSVWAYDEATGTKRNEFYDAGKPDGLSDMHRHWIAGLLKHSKAMTALCCPTVNCYRRLHNILAPHSVDWGIDDRLATYRAKSYSQSATYTENRLPSGSCNPYLVLACTVAAGIDGIVNRLECPPPKKENMDAYMDYLECQIPKKDDTPDFTHLPYSLEEALESLENDDVLKSALGEEMVRWFVQEKRDNEVTAVKDLDDEIRYSKERDLYFEFL